jgi:hypothetical protein
LVDISNFSQSLWETSTKARVAQQFGDSFAKSHKIQNLHDIVHLISKAEGDNPVVKSLRGSSPANRLKLADQLVQYITSSGLSKKWEHSLKLQLCGKGVIVEMNAPLEVVRSVVSQSGLKESVKVAIRRRIDRVQLNQLYSSQGAAIMLLSFDVDAMQKVDAIHAQQEYELDSRGKVNFY